MSSLPSLGRACSECACWVSRLGGQLIVPSRLIDRKEIVKVAQQVGKSPAQVSLRWNVQRGVSVLPKTDIPWQMQVRGTFPILMSCSTTTVVRYV